MPDLIAITDIRSLANLNSNVEERRVKTGITAAHLELEKILGRTGYAIVYGGATSYAGQGANAAAYVTLLNSYIKPFMAWRALEVAYPDLYAEADRAGVFVKDGDDFRSVNGQELALKIKQAERMASEYRQRLIEHVRENDNVFTWLDTNVDGEQRITNGRPTGGFVLRRVSRQDSYRG